MSTRSLCAPLLLLAATLLSATALAAAPAVLVSVKPLQMLAQGVTEGIATPGLLIPAEASPHGYSLKPSAVASLHAADLVFWVGPGLEGQLAAGLARLPASVRVEAVLSWPELAALPLRAGDEHEHAAQLDAHFWLDPQRARRVVLRMAEILAQVDAGNGTRYRANAQALAQRLDALDRELALRLEPVKTQAFWVYHDGYQYFERRYGLNRRGALNLSAEQALKPQALMRLEAEPGTACVFLDSQYGRTSLARRLADRNLRLVELDPLGVRQAGTSAGYAAMLRELGERFAACLTPAN